MATASTSITLPASPVLPPASPRRSRPVSLVGAPSPRASAPLVAVSATPPQPPAPLAPSSATVTVAPIPPRPPSPPRSLQPVVAPPVMAPPTPRRSRPTTISSASTPVASTSVIDELVQHGYQPIDMVYFTNPQNQPEARYIKASNELGESVYIELDTGGFVAIQPDKVPMRRSQDQPMVPTSLKRGAFECSGMNTSGVAFECSEGVCTVIREPRTLETQEENFVYSAVPPGGTGRFRPVAYPIVKLSEVKVNPRAVLKNTDEATRRLRRATYQHAREELQRTQELSRQLQQAFERFYATANDATDNLAASLEQLEGYNLHNIEYPPNTTDGKRAATQVRDNLRLRHDKMADLIRIMEAASEQREQVQDHLRMLADYTRYLETNFSQLDRVLT